VSGESDWRSCGLKPTAFPHAVLGAVAAFIDGRVMVCGGSGTDTNLNDELSHMCHVFDK
jgi:hypothetical protein